MFENIEEILREWCTGISKISRQKEVFERIQQYSIGILKKYSNSADEKYTVIQSALMSIQSIPMKEIKSVTSYYTKILQSEARKNFFSKNTLSVEKHVVDALRTCEQGNQHLGIYEKEHSLITHWWKKSEWDSAYVKKYYDSDETIDFLPFSLVEGISQEASQNFKQENTIRYFIHILEKISEDGNPKAAQGIFLKNVYINQRQLSITSKSLDDNKGDDENQTLHDTLPSDFRPEGIFDLIFENAYNSTIREKDLQTKLLIYLSLNDVGLVKSEEFFKTIKRYLPELKSLKKSSIGNYNKTIVNSTLSSVKDYIYQDIENEVKEEFVSLYMQYITQRIEEFLYEKYQLEVKITSKIEKGKKTLEKKEFSISKVDVNNFQGDRND